MEIVVVSPYYKETTETLKRCHDSVLAQTYPGVKHYLVSDGFPNAEVDNWDATHMKIPCHGDFGDTPRALGSMSAATLGADAVIFLDADNWIEPDHVELMVGLHQRHNAQIVTATRMLRRPDGSVLGVCNESNGREFNDTNCYFVTKSAFPVISAWVFKDKRLAITGDRIFWDAVQRMGYSRAHSMMPTVNYTTNFACHFQAFGEQPPLDSKIILRFQGREHSQTVSFADYQKIVTGQMELPPPV